MTDDFYAIFLNTGNALYLLEEDGTFLDINKASEEMYGYSREEIIGNSPEMLSAPGYNQNIDLQQYFREALDGHTVRFKWWALRKSGEIFPKEVTLNRSYFKGRYIIVANGRDITDFEITLDHLQKNESLLKAIGRNFPQGSITVINSRYIVEYADGEEFNLQGKDPEELLGKSIFEQPPINSPQGVDYEETKARIDHILEGNKVTYERKFGNNVYYYEGKPLRDPDSGEYLAMITCQNITKIRNTQEKLATREEYSTPLTPTSLEGIYRSTTEGEIVYANQAFAEIFGYDNPEELRGVNGKKLYYHKGERDQILETLDQGHSIRNREVGLVKKDGSFFWGLLNSSKNHDGHGNTVYDGAINDITERKQLESTLKEEKHFSEMVINSLPGIMAIADENFNFIEWNEQLEKITGYTPEEISGKTPLDLLTPEKHKQFEEVVVETLKTGAQNFMEVEILTKNGEKLPFYLSGSLIYKGERPMVLGAGIEISDKKAIENQLKNSLEEKKILLKEIHHRVKNNLAIINSLLYLKSQQIENPETRTHFFESQARIKSMALVHEKLYQSTSLSRINIKSYLEELSDQVEQTFALPEQNIKTHIRGDNIKLNINKAVPFGLLINELLCNAYEHAFKDLNEGQVHLSFREENGQIQLTLKDDGQGFPENGESQQSLGLNLVYGLTDQLGGSISFKNIDGTEAHLQFPLQ